jgi:hypothetical protein
MRLPPELHSWSVSVSEATRLQTALRDRLRLEWDERPVRSVAGVDVHFPHGAAVAAIVVLSYPALEVLEEAVGETAPGSSPSVKGRLSWPPGPPFGGSPTSSFSTDMGRPIPAASAWPVISACGSIGPRWAWRRACLLAQASYRAWSPGARPSLRPKRTRGASWVRPFAPGEVPARSMFPRGTAST